MAVELSYLAPQNFYLQIDNLPEVSFLCQNVQVPSITGGEVDMPNRFNSTRTYLPGDGVDYGTLDVTFLVDKNMKNYRTIMEWLKGINTPESGQQYTDYNGDNKYMDTLKNMTLICTDASQEPLAEWRFKNSFPVSLDGFQFDATAMDIDYITATASFRFHYFENLVYTDGALESTII